MPKFIKGDVVRNKNNKKEFLILTTPRKGFYKLYNLDTKVTGFINTDTVESQAFKVGTGNITVTYNPTK